ncbi:unnamed protein product [Vitrella brassicaformis CCMP3155]|uniref:F-box domain-containing protein n=2 Tax=Vitrella brassicaformis TaxID=1169539 RepID=A0A0G4FZU2_VITBC|nr:unnamed protein product [Vitrella brassicaformis CCMP3155]|eukprot:CEM21163.1 unnamed protein product [Vitrella brassicaformis CCMP3155]
MSSSSSEGNGSFLLEVCGPGGAVGAQPTATWSLDLIPADCANLLVQYTDTKSLSKLTLVNRVMRDHALDDVLWERAFNRKFRNATPAPITGEGQERVPPERLGWFNCFIRKSVEMTVRGKTLQTVDRNDALNENESVRHLTALPSGMILSVSSNGMIRLWGYDDIVEETVALTTHHMAPIATPAPSPSPPDQTHPAPAPVPESSPGSQHMPDPSSPPLPASSPPTPLTHECPHSDAEFVPTDVQSPARIAGDSPPQLAVSHPQGGIMMQRMSKEEPVSMGKRAKRRQRLESKREREGEMASLASPSDADAAADMRPVSADPRVHHQKGGRRSSKSGKHAMAIAMHSDLEGETAKGSGLLPSLQVSPPWANSCASDASVESCGPLEELPENALLALDIQEGSPVAQLQLSTDDMTLKVPPSASASKQTRGTGQKTLLEMVQESTKKGGISDTSRTSSMEADDAPRVGHDTPQQDPARSSQSPCPSPAPDASPSQSALPLPPPPGPNTSSAKPGGRKEKKAAKRAAMEEKKAWRAEMVKKNKAKKGGVLEAPSPISAPPTTSSSPADNREASVGLSAEFLPSLVHIQSVTERHPGYAANVSAAMLAGKLIDPCDGKGPLLCASIAADTRKMMSCMMQKVPLFANRHPSSAPTFDLELPALQLDIVPQEPRAVELAEVDVGVGVTAALFKRLGEEEEGGDEVEDSSQPRIVLRRDGSSDSTDEPPHASTRGWSTETLGSTQPPPIEPLSPRDTQEPPRQVSGDSTTSASADLRVTAVALSGNGCLMLIGLESGDVQLWEVAPGRWVSGLGQKGGGKGVPGGSVMWAEDATGLMACGFCDTSAMSAAAFCSEPSTGVPLGFSQMRAAASDLAASLTQPGPRRSSLPGTHTTQKPQLLLGSPRLTAASPPSPLLGPVPANTPSSFPIAVGALITGEMVVWTLKKAMTEDSMAPPMTLHWQVVPPSPKASKGLSPSLLPSPSPPAPPAASASASAPQASPQPSPLLRPEASPERPLLHLLSVVPWTPQTEQQIENTPRGSLGRLRVWVGVAGGVGGARVCSVQAMAGAGAGRERERERDGPGRVVSPRSARGPLSSVGALGSSEERWVVEELVQGSAALASLAVFTCNLGREKLCSYCVGRVDGSICRYDIKAVTLSGKMTTDLITHEGLQRAPPTPTPTPTPTPPAPDQPDQPAQEGTTHTREETEHKDANTSGGKRQSLTIAVPPRGGEEVLGMSRWTVVCERRWKVKRQGKKAVSAMAACPMLHILITGCEDGAFRFFDLWSGECYRSVWPHGQGVGIRALAFSTYRGVAVSAGAQDKTLKFMRFLGGRDSFDVARPHVGRKGNQRRGSGHPTAKLGTGKGYLQGDWRGVVCDSRRGLRDLEARIKSLDVDNDDFDFFEGKHKRF